MQVNLEVNDDQESAPIVTFLLQDYGGYLALMLIKSTEGMIRCAAAQAPVVDWTMYGESDQFRSFT